MTSASSLMWGFLIWGVVIGQAVVMALFVADRALIDNPLGVVAVVGILCASGGVGVAAEWVWRGRHLRRFPVWEQ